MPWWPKRGGRAGSGKSATVRGEGGVRIELPSPRSPEPTEAVVGTVDMTRLAAALDRLEIRYLTDGDGSLLAMWERHAVLFALEGPDDEILVIRARPHGTVPPDWADRAYRVVNEWNHSRRFSKAVNSTRSTDSPRCCCTQSRSRARNASSPTRSWIAWRSRAAEVYTLGSAKASACGAPGGPYFCRRSPSCRRAADLQASL